MNAGKRTADAAYDRTGYANVADKFVTCVQREGSFSITTEDCRNLLALISERDALREACRALIASVDKGDTQLTWSWEYITANNLQDGTSNIDAMRAALAIADGAR